MNSPRSRRLRRLATSGALAIAACASFAGQAGASQADYDTALDVGTDAYKYGLPLLTGDKTFQTQTSIDKPNSDGYGPVNQFNHVRKFATAEDRSIVAPNQDTLYSIAWLNLKKQPQVIHVPKIKDRYYVIPLMSPYSEDFKNIGSVNKSKPGDYAVTGPGQEKVDLPKGVKRVRSEFSRVLIIGRIFADHGKDVKNVNKIQDQLTVTPLDKFGKDWKPKKPKNPDTTVDDVPLPSGLDYFDRMGELLEQFPPPAADEAELAKLATVGIGPGLAPSENPNLNEDTLRGLTDAVAGGNASVLADARTRYLAGFADHNGYLVQPTGNYGTDYELRAIVTQIGYGALTPEEAIYPLAQVDSSAGPLTGEKKYVVHFPAGGLPPVDEKTGFWSLTVYDLEGFFVPNPLDRYLVNDRSDLEFNADGSLDVYLQAEQPTDPKQLANWLPTPPGGFRAIWRFYATQTDQIDGILDGTGYDPPAITAVP